MFKQMFWFQTVSDKLKSQKGKLWLLVPGLLLRFSSHTSNGGGAND